MQSSDNTSLSPSSCMSRWDWVGFALALACVIWFICVPQAYTYHQLGHFSALGWWLPKGNWGNTFSETAFIPFISMFLLYRVWKKRHDISLHKSILGLGWIALGAMFGLIAIQTHQPRIALASFSTMLVGISWYYWGLRFALRCAFPLYFLLLLAIPPTLEQSTVGLQIISTKLANWGASLFGVETIAEGTNISSVSGKWDSFNIAGGCSGLNSLKTLLLISLPWAFLADNLKLWKRIILIISSIPLAIVSNSFRIASIFVLAEHVNPIFAGKTWHDWSGLTLFFPASLLGLFLIHSILVGEFSFLKKRRAVIRKNTSTHA